MTSSNVDEITERHQCTFESNRSTINCIFQTLETKVGRRRKEHRLLIVFSKVYNSDIRKVLCYILADFGTCIKLAGLTKFLNKTYSTVRMGNICVLRAFSTRFWITRCFTLLYFQFNPLNPELNPSCYLLALLAHHFLHISRIRVKSYIYIYIWH